MIAFKKRPILFILFIDILLGCISCEKKDSFPLPIRFLLVNAYNLSPSVEVHIDNEKKETVDFTKATSYLDTYAGKRMLKLVPVGSSYGNIVYEDALYLVDNRKYSFFFVNTYPSPDSVALLQLEDKFPILTATQAAIRFVHLSPDAGAVDLYEVGETEPLAKGIKFRGIVDYKAVSAQNYNFVSVTGTVTKSDTLKNVAINPGRFYTVYLAGVSNASDTTKASTLTLQWVENR